MIKIAVDRTSEDTVILLENLTVTSDGRTITVPAGFRCDGASVPAFLWSSVSPQIDPRTLRGAIVHDFIYRTHPPQWSRRDADKLFYGLIRADGLSWWKSQKAYLGVRLFGASSWEQER